MIYSLVYKRTEGPGQETTGSRLTPTLPPGGFDSAAAARVHAKLTASGEVLQCAIRIKDSGAVMLIVTTPTARNDELVSFDGDSELRVGFVDSKKAKAVAELAAQSEDDYRARVRLFGDERTPSKEEELRAAEVALDATRSYYVFEITSITVTSRPAARIPAHQSSSAPSVQPSTVPDPSLDLLKYATSLMGQMGRMVGASPVDF